ncbi:cell wall-associated hydrolase [Corynebacterium jeikeium]|uniref:DIP1281 family NlpC/P60 protein n=1 Tax=Corynebacterium jeikeium TaxID=38289 RepID=UPI000E1918DA|nr:NlpC/P60 family protein [Corynebacterium jeikeium]SUY85513.1 cell wall-associated hydrolase [Corynebacterium jeikeium]
MTPRPQSRKRTVLAVAVTAGVTLQSTTMVAQADDKRTVESFLADLVGQVSRAKSQVSEMETLMGSLREDANKARVDLVNSQSAAQTAQDKVMDARGRLKDSDTEVTKAQAKLNDIARSAYAQGGDASAVNLAAGGSDAVGDTLDRSSYIDAASKKQKDEVDRLDLARTQNANEESSLRDSRDKANSAVDDAVSKYNTARDTLNNSQKSLTEKQKEYKRLLDEKSKAEKALREARAAVETFTNTHPEASSWDKRKVAEKAAEKAGAEVEKAEDAEDKAPETPAEETQSTENSTETTETTETTENTEDAQPAKANESTESDQSDQSDESPAQGSLGNPAGLPELPAELQSSYDLNASGDSQRQAALDGLRKAGESALMAGFTTALSGNPDGAMAAAAQAGRETAGKEYDRAMGGGATTAPAAQETPATPATPATPETEAAAETPETPETPATPETPDTGVAPEAPATPENPAEAIADALDPSSPDDSGTAEEKIERVIKRAESQLGLPYAWGGGNYHGPTKGIRDGGVADAHGDYNKVGFDCSGLMMYAFYGVGIELQHYSGYQYTAGKQVPSSQAKRGDMLFWPGHVALYLGDGKMIEAPQSGDVVKVSDVRWGGMQPMAVRMIE